MNLSFIQSFSTSALCFFREKAEIVLTPQQKKIAAIVSLALGCLAALYLVYHCCCLEAEVKIGEDEDKDDDPFSLEEISKGRKIEKFEFKDGTVAEGFYTDLEHKFVGKKIDFDGKIEEGMFEYAEPGKNLHGRGKITFPNGSLWQGYFKFGELCGKGKKIYHNGTIEEGEFKKSKLHGKGTVSIPEGDTITGFFEEDKLNGYGKVVHPDGSIDEGLFQDGILVKRKTKPTDSASEVTEKNREEDEDELSYYYPPIWANSLKKQKLKKIEFKDGSVIEGFSHPLSAGFLFVGKKTYFDGRIDIGEFDQPEGRLWGKGKITFPAGLVWKGEFIHNYLVRGKKIHPDGTVEEGEFKLNKLCKGTITIPEGDTITGFFEKDKLNGYGKVVHPDGSIDEGLFEDGVLVKPKPKPTYSAAKITEEKKEELS